MRLAVLASGNGSNFEALVRTFQQTHTTETVVLLLVDQKNAYAIERAKYLSIPFIVLEPKQFQSKQAYEACLLTQLEVYAIDLIVLAGYMRIISPTLLSAYPKRILNIHPSYLPSFPGKQGIKDAYEAGVDYTGVTVHVVDEGVDTGPIIMQQKLQIYPSESIETLETRIHELEHQLYPKAIVKYSQYLKEREHACTD